MKRILLTGPPASGKSSVIEMLNGRGYASHPEVAREAIQLFTRFLPENMPHKDPRFFNNFVECNMLADYQKPGGAIFDRGFVDQLAYRKHYGVEVPGQLSSLVFSFRYDQVFFFPYWDKIFVQDGERKEDRNEAQTIEALLREAYEDAGYKVIDVPNGSIEQRANFIELEAFGVTQDHRRLDY